MGSSFQLVVTTQYFANGYLLIYFWDRPDILGLSLIFLRKSLGPQESTNYISHQENNISKEVLKNFSRKIGVLTQHSFNRLWRKEFEVFTSFDGLNFEIYSLKGISNVEFLIFQIAIWDTSRNKRLNPFHPLFDGWENGTKKRLIWSVGETTPFTHWRQGNKRKIKTTSKVDILCWIPILTRTS
jgi:hypothetical protein